MLAIAPPPGSTPPERATPAPRRPLQRPYSEYRNRYSDGRFHRAARGRYAPRGPIQDGTTSGPYVVDLDREKITTDDFIARIEREMKIRFYMQRTRTSYRHALRGFLRWFAKPPGEATQEDVRSFIELLVDGGASSSWISTNLSAIRTTFDKMSGKSVTLGLLTPRRPKRLPVVLSQKEVLRLLMAAPSMRDKLLLGLRYATGGRVNEVVRLRWRDVDFERSVINIWEGKGRKDRQVALPESFRPLLENLSKASLPTDYLFPTTPAYRHICPRTAQRVMARAVAIADIKKAATCHSLRHYAEFRIMLGSGSRSPGDTGCGSESRDGRPPGSA